MGAENSSEKRTVLVLGWVIIPILIGAYFALPQYIGPWYLMSRFVGGSHNADFIWNIFGLAILLLSGALGYSLVHRRFSRRLRLVVGAFAFISAGFWLAAFIAVQNLPAGMPRPIYW
jgi:hypothetical protein